MWSETGVGFLAGGRNKWSIIWGKIICWHAVQINTCWRLNSRFLGGQVVVIDRGAVMSEMDKVLKRGH